VRRMPIALVALLVWAVACSAQPAAPVDPLQGAWRLVSMRLVPAEGESFEIPVQESFILFADGYYSIGYAFGDSGSVRYAERWRPTL